MAERTGLEPATPGVTGRYSNQLNYRSVEVAAYSTLGFLPWQEKNSFFFHKIKLQKKCKKMFVF